MTNAEQITALAAQFAADMREALTPSQWQEMCDRNAVQTNLFICHSHDFCDANMVMAGSFEVIIGREPDASDPADCAIWNAAWADAMPTLRGKES